MALKETGTRTTNKELGDWPILPVEIFEGIIKQVALEEEEQRKDLQHVDDSDSEKYGGQLRKLCYVCWTFTHLCRPLIWESISIAFELGGPKPSLETLSGLIDKTPALASYIKRVSCSFDATMYEPNTIPGLSVLFKLHNVKEFEIPDESTGLNDWTLYYMREEKSLAWRVTLDHFMSCNLTSITISNMCNPPIIDLFSLRSLETLKLKICTMTKPTLLSMETVGCTGFNIKRFVGSDLKNFPLAILNCCPSLEDLELTSVEVSDDTLAPNPILDRTFSSYRKLRKFRTQGFFDCSNLVRLIERAGLTRLPALKGLNVTILGGDEIYGVQQLLGYCQSLEQIYLENSRQSVSISEEALRELILSSKATLKDLWLCYGVESVEEAERSTGELCNILEQMRGNNVLEELTTGTDFQCLDSELLQPSSIRGWERLDEVLLGNDGADFPRLKEVVICLEPFVYPTSSAARGASGGSDARLKTFLHKPLKGLFSTNRFKFMSAINVHMMGGVHYGI